MSEIKLHSTPVEQSLNELKTSIQSMNTSFSKNASGDSSVEVVDKLQEMKQLLENITLTYQSLVLENTETANQVIEKLKETDKSVATSFQLLR